MNQTLVFNVTPIERRLLQRLRQLRRENQKHMILLDLDSWELRAAGRTEPLASSEDGCAEGLEAGLDNGPETGVE